MRKYYIDNLRSITILLLFPVHTFMIWNDFGSRFYIWEGENKLLSTLIVLVNPWFMPLLFVLAGMSACYAQKKRSRKEFVVQRFFKLCIPFLSGLVLLVPIQTLYARKYFEHDQSGYWANLKYFFTHVTDFSGYDGAFTPGHLWFVLFLFLIAMAALPFFEKLPCEMISEKVGRTPVWILLLLFLPIWLMYYLGNFGGFSLGKDFALYLIGYYFLSNETVMEKLEHHAKLLFGLWLAGMVLLAGFYIRYSYYGDLWVNAIGWISLLAVLVFGKRFLNRQMKFTDYFRKASYPIYLLHQSILVVVAYYILAFSGSGPAQGASASGLATDSGIGNVLRQICGCMPGKVLCICLGSFLLTLLSYHVIRGIPVVRKMIGIK